jgi:hypothetical protein
VKAKDMARAVMPLQFVAALEKLAVWFLFFLTKYLISLRRKSRP